MTEIAIRKTVHDLICEAKMNPTWQMWGRLEEALDQYSNKQGRQILGSLLDILRQTADELHDKLMCK